MKVYIDRNNIQVELIRFRKKIATLLTLESLQWDNFFCVYEIGLIAIREVSLPFGEEPCNCARTRAFVYFIFQLTKNADSYGIVLWIAIWTSCTSQETTWMFNSYDSVKKDRLYSGFLFRIEEFNAISLTERNSRPDRAYCHSTGLGPSTGYNWYSHL